MRDTDRFIASNGGDHDLADSKFDARINKSSCFKTVSTKKSKPQLVLLTKIYKVYETNKALCAQL